MVTRATSFTDDPRVAINRDIDSRYDIIKVVADNIDDIKALNNVDNTSDIDKPVSTATQLALDTKLNLSGGNLSGPITTSSTIAGRNVAIDGTKLDGVESGATADQTASEILTTIKTVDGPSSGLNADLLDGLEASAFATSTQGTKADSAVQATQSIVSLLAITPYDSTLIAVSAYHANGTYGGGLFKYVANMSQSMHDGGTVIAIDAVFPSDWSDVTQKAGWFNSSYIGLGCFVRQTIDSITYSDYFGAVGDGITDETITLQVAINSAPYCFVVAAGSFVTSSPLIVAAQITVAGFGAKRGSATGTSIRNNGTGECLVYSDLVPIYDRGIYNIALTAVNGHALRIKHGCIRCAFQSILLDSRSIDHSALYGKYTSANAGLMSCVFSGGEYFGANTVDRNVPIIDLSADYTIINENVFRDMWISYSKGVNALSVIATNGALFTNNRFSGLTFEVAEGGLIKLEGHKHASLEGISAWDSPVYTGDLITFDRCTATTITGYGRMGGTPDVGVVDIRLTGSGGGTTITSFSDVGAVNEAIDWGGQTGVIIGGFSTTRVDSNAQRVVLVDGDKIVAGKHTSVTGSDVTLESTGNAITRIRAEFSGDSRSVDLDIDPFYGGFGALRPNVSGQLDLGALTVPWKTVHALSYTSAGVSGKTGSFTSADGKTITVSAGIITGIA